MKFFIKTYGCKINQYDSAVLRGHLLSQGFEETENLEDADMIFLNSCVVTHRAERDARHFLNRIRRKKKAGAKVFFTGCGANFMPEPEDEGIFSGDFSTLSKILGITRQFPVFTRTRPFVKIQEGCDFKCTYCVVPRVRGTSRSRPLAEILDEIRFHLEHGAKEIVLTGTQIGHWGREWGLKLENLISEILMIDGEFRLRISSIAPVHVSDRLIELFRRNPHRLAPHVHISLQSGSEKVLKDMKRPYSIEKYVSIVQKIKDEIPGVAIGTDIIVGFPTETDEDFERTLRLVEDLPFAYLHVFEYSPRPGTEAFELGDIPSNVKKERVRRLLALVEEKRQSFKRENIGRKLLTLVESRKNGSFVGTTGNYLRVHIKGERIKEGEFKEVLIKEPLPQDRDVVGVVVSR